MTTSILIVCAYLFGSIPTGVLLGKLRGIDPRLAGSGNLGASNVARTMGVFWGALTLLGDAVKSALPTYLALRYGDLPLACLCGFISVLGHCYPVWLRFAGGKGVASAFGVVAVLLPVVCAIAALAWAVLLSLTRIPAVGSMAAALIFVLAPHAEAHPFEVHGLTFALAVLLVIRHRRNLGVLKARMLKKKTVGRKNSRHR